MLSEKAYNQLIELHATAGADWRVIFDRARNLANQKSSRIQGLWRTIEERGPRSAFFETWSAFWFPSSQISLASRIELGAHMLVSATAIAQLDHFADQQNSAREESYCRELSDCATLWESYAEDVFSNCERWSDHVPTWTMPRHGIESANSAEELLLAKNPFYPAAVRTYDMSPNKSTFARGLTVALGLLDDAADIKEDFLAGNYNAIFPVEHQFLWHGDLRSLQYETFRRDSIGRAVDRAIELLKDMKMAASAAEMTLLACTLEKLLESLTGYPELCAARLIME